MDSDLRDGSFDSSEKIYRMYNRFFALGKKQKVAQSFNNENKIVTALACGDLHMFYRNELEYRKLFEYPPYGHLISFNVSHEFQDTAERDAEILYCSLNQIKDIAVFEPLYIGNRYGNKKHQYRIIVKVKKIDTFRKSYKQIERQFYIKRGKNTLKSGLSIVVDNPSI